MKKLFLGLGLGLGICVLCASNARAGNKASYPISVSSTAANGQVANVRASSGSVAFITCWTEASGTSVDSYVTCIGRDSSGVQKSCLSRQASFIAVASSINGDSYIDFGTDEGSNFCSWLEVENGSTMAPKAP